VWQAQAHAFADPLRDPASAGQDALFRPWYNPHLVVSALRRTAKEKQ
jgi:hypothetical protein